jgi:hypothetical protein
MAAESFQVHSEVRGSHWIAWISRDGSGKPDRSVVIIAGSKEEAEKRAERWGQRQA